MFRIRETFTDDKLTPSLYVAKDGVKALAFLHRDKRFADAPRPNIILLDLNLPKKDGREVLARSKLTES